MADYYPLLAKAVSALPSSTPETRGAIYERARKALLGQLRSMQPPPPDEVIDREANALDEAVARLEAEVALAEPPVAPEPEPPAKVEVEDAAPAAGQEKLDEKPDEKPDEDAAGAQPREVQRPAAPKPVSAGGGGLRRLALILGGVALVVGLVGVAAWKLRDRPEDLASRAPAPEAADPKAAGKIGERIGSDGAPARPSRPADAGSGALPVAYRAGLLVQDPAEQSGVKTYKGTVLWRRDSSNQGPNQQLAPTIRADIDLPDAQFRMTMTIEKNFEAALPVSHTITLRFDPAPGSPIGGINAINMPEMRRNDAPKGSPLLGLPVDVATNVFLVGLSSAAQQPNIEAIRNQAWFDIPISLSSGRVAKATFEKGAAGQQVVDEVLAEWKRQ